MVARVIVEYDDGTVAIWGDVDDDIADEIEELIGTQPDTLHC